MKNNPEAYDEIRILWKEMLKCGMCIGAFVDNPEGGKPLIAGANMLYVFPTEGAPDPIAVSVKSPGKSFRYMNSFQTDPHYSEIILKSASEGIRVSSN